MVILSPGTACSAYPICQSFCTLLVSNMEIALGIVLKAECCAVDLFLKKGVVLFLFPLRSGFRRLPLS